MIRFVCWRCGGWHNIQVSCDLARWWRGRPVEPRQQSAADRIEAGALTRYRELRP